MKNHEFGYKMRAKMINWMIEVNSKYDMREKTFFLTIDIMDRFLGKSKKLNIDFNSFNNFKLINKLKF